MSKRQSREMRRRWRSRDYRDKVIPSIRQSVRRTLRPKVTVGATPDPSTERPPQINEFIENRNDECCEVTSCEPMRVGRDTVWRVALIDGDDHRLSERYYPLVHEHGLHLYQISSRPLATISGVAVVLFVGLAKGEA